MAGPVRTCIGCGARREKAELVRLVARDGMVEVDAAKKAPGRGAHVCNGACAAAAAQKRALGRAFRKKVAADDSLAERVERAKGGSGLGSPRAG